MEQLLEEIRAYMARRTQVDPALIDPEDDLFMSLGIDSLEGLKLITSLEYRYQVTIPDHRLPELNTLQRLAETIFQLKSPALSA